jgi:hypothetical protein
MASANVELVRGLYDAFSRGDGAAALGAMAPDIVWNEADGHPYADGNPYVGPQAVAAGVFGRLAGDWDGFTVKMDKIHDAGDTVVACGRYTGACRATGKPINAQVTHVWTVAGGKLSAFQQYTDTLQFVQAMTP